MKWGSERKLVGEGVGVGESVGVGEGVGVRVGGILEWE